MCLFDTVIFNDCFCTWKLFMVFIKASISLDTFYRYSDLWQPLMMLEMSRAHWITLHLHTVDRRPQSFAEDAIHRHSFVLRGDCSHATFFFFALQFMPSTWKMYAKRRINKTPHNHCACRTYLIVCLHFMFGCLVGCYRCDSPFNWAPQLNRGAMHNIFGRFNYSARIYGQHA